jgi:uncharacterized protein (DUF736 family)
MKFFNLQKNANKKTETQPDYRISVNIGDKDNSNYVEAGACWIKKDKKGNNFLSCKLADAYADHTKNVARKGFELVMEGQTEVVEKYADEPKEAEQFEDVGF